VGSVHLPATAGIPAAVTGLADMATDPAVTGLADMAMAPAVLVQAGRATDRAATVLAPAVTHRVAMDQVATDREPTVPETRAIMVASTR
jgi:hypothetical protein